MRSWLFEAVSRIYDVVKIIQYEIFVNREIYTLIINLLF